MKDEEVFNYLKRSIAMVDKDVKYGFSEHTPAYQRGYRDAMDDALNDLKKYSDDYTEQALIKKKKKNN